MTNEAVLQDQTDPRLSVTLRKTSYREAILVIVSADKSVTFETEFEHRLANNKNTLEYYEAGDIRTFAIFMGPKVFWIKKVQSNDDHLSLLARFTDFELTFHVDTPEEATATHLTINLQLFTVGRDFTDMGFKSRMRNELPGYEWSLTVPVEQLKGWVEQFIILN